MTLPGGLPAAGQKLGAPSDFSLLGLIFTGVGLGLVIAGLVVSIPRWNLVADGAVATGTVVSFTRTSKGNQRPVVEFKPPRGRAIRTTATVGTSSGTYRVGERIRVYYDRQEPEDNVLDPFTELWFFLMLLCGRGTLFSGMGMPLLVLALVRRRARSKVRRGGWHVPAVVVEVRRAGRGFWKPTVEAVDPATGQRTHYVGDSASSVPTIGRTATVHVEPQPPHRYFVELSNPPTMAPRPPVEAPPVPAPGPGAYQRF